MFLGIFGIAKASFMPIKAIIGQHYLEAAWKESLRNNRLSKPWKSADFYMIGKLKAAIPSGWDANQFEYKYKEIVPAKLQTISSKNEWYKSSDLMQKSEMYSLPKTA